MQSVVLIVIMHSTNFESCFYQQQKITSEVRKSSENKYFLGGKNTADFVTAAIRIM